MEIPTRIGRRNFLNVMSRDKYIYTTMHMLTPEMHWNQIEFFDACLGFHNDDRCSFVEMVQAGIDLNAIRRNGPQFGFRCARTRLGLKGMIWCMRLGLTGLMSAVICGDERVVDILLSLGADVDIHKIHDLVGDRKILPTEDRALELACRMNHLTILQKLLVHGADVNLRTEQVGGQGTALMVAAHHGIQDNVACLVRFGADASLRTVGHDGLSGMTAREICVKSVKYQNWHDKNGNKYHEIATYLQNIEASQNACEFPLRVANLKQERKEASHFIAVSKIPLMFGKESRGLVLVKRFAGRVLFTEMGVTAAWLVVHDNCHPDVRVALQEEVNKSKQLHDKMVQKWREDEAAELWRRKRGNGRRGRGRGRGRAGRGGRGRGRGGRWSRTVGWIPNFE